MAALSPRALSQGFYGDRVEDLRTGRAYESREELLRDQQRQAEAQAYQNYILGALGMGGGGGMRSGAPSGGSPGGMGGAYADAFNAARNANVSRYNDILGGYDNLLGGGAKPAPKTATLSTSRWSNMVGNSPVASWQKSGTQLSYSAWKALQKRLEQEAARMGGAYGSIDASRVYPRMWGQGEYLGAPGSAAPGGAYGQRPNIPPPVYPTYTPPVRGNQNY
jgi:hypothetical protein